MVNTVTKQRALAPCRDKQTMPWLFLPARGGYLESWQAANRTCWQSQLLGNPDKAELWKNDVVSNPSPAWISNLCPHPASFSLPSSQPPAGPFCCHFLTLPPAPCFLEKLQRQLQGFKRIPQMLHSHPIFLQPCPSDLFTLGKRRVDKANSCGKKTNLFCGIFACAIWRRKQNWKDKEITAPRGNSCTALLSFLPLLSSTTCLNAHTLLPAHHCTSVPTFCPGPPQCSWKILSPPF